MTKIFTALTATSSQWELYGEVPSHEVRYHVRKIRQMNPGVYVKTGR
jgi:hypothetical protein